MEDGGYLVLADTGTNAGFHVIAEARDYLNQVRRPGAAGSPQCVAQISRLASQEEAGSVGDTVGHCVSPCPHDSPCPRHSQDSVPCNFPVRYRNFSFSVLPKDEVHTEHVSYLVFKKVTVKFVSLPVTTIMCQAVRSEQGLPRLLESPVKTKTSFYCRLCTGSGQLQEVLARRKDDNDLFQLCKRLQWGDTMPVKLHKVENRQKIGTPWMKHKQSA